MKSRDNRLLGVQYFDNWFDSVGSYSYPEAYRDTFHVFVDSNVKPVNRKINHNHSFHKIVGRAIYGDITGGSSNGYSLNISGVLSGYPVLEGPADVPAYLYNQALSRLYDEQRGGLDLSVDTYQWKQTVRLAEDIFRVVRYVRTFNVPALFSSFRKYRVFISRTGRNRSFRGVGSELGPVELKQAIKAGGGLWLQYSYGLKPLVEDCFGIMDQLTRDMEPLMVIRGSASHSEPKNWTGAGSVAGQPATRSFSSQASYRTKIFCSFRHSTASLQEFSRFSSVNPVSIIWENTPFSFVVDWFVDLGGYLRSLESAMLSRSQFVDGYVVNSLRREIFDTYSVGEGGYSPSLGFYSKGGSAKGFSYECKKDRSVLTSSPLPRPPSFRMDFSSPLKALNAASLLTQFFGKRT